MNPFAITPKDALFNIVTGKCSEMREIPGPDRQIILLYYIYIYSKLTYQALVPFGFGHWPACVLAGV